VGFLLFFAGFVALFFVVRAIPADWEIGPFKIDASGSAADPAASLYFADDPHAPFWLLVPTFNLPPRFFAARPHTTNRPVALGPVTPSSPLPSATVTTIVKPESLGVGERERQCVGQRERVRQRQPIRRRLPNALGHTNTDAHAYPHAHAHRNPHAHAHGDPDA